MHDHAEYTVGVFTLTLRAQSRIVLPPYAGSTLRGGIGWALSQRVSSNVYRVLYAPSPPREHRMANQDHAPQPLVLVPPIPPDGYGEVPVQRREVQKGETFCCGISLVGTRGNFTELLPFVIRAFEVLGSEFGLGKGLREGMGRFRIEEVLEGRYQNGWGQRLYATRAGARYKDPQGISFAEIRQLAERWRHVEEIGLKFLTPTRLVRNGKPVAPRDLTFPILMRNLLRRTSLLGELYGGVHAEPAYFHRLLEQAAEVQVAYNQLACFPWWRYSSTQDTTVDMTGMVGEVAFKGNFAELLPFLLWGELIHLGKGTMTGMGKYTLLF